MQAPLQLVKTNGDAVPDTYIIKLKGHISKATHWDLLRSEKPTILPSIQLNFNPEIFNGYVAELNVGELNFLLNCDHIERIEEDSFIPPPASIEEPSTDTEPQAVDANEQANLDAGRGVDIYVLDSGVNIYHECFGDRAEYGKNCTNEPENKDTMGHGTHVAGIAAGKTYGQATAASVISVKVLTSKGGRASWEMDGIVWAYERFIKQKRPAVINMSVGGPKSLSEDDAVLKAIEAGVSIVAAAGNDNKDCKDLSPAGVKEAIVIGAVDEKNHKRKLSNYGATLKAWAPGTDILSAWIGNSNKETKRCSGTSQAAPCVAGYIAIALGRKSLKPVEVTKELQDHAKPEVKDAPEGTTKLLAKRW